MVEWERLIYPITKLEANEVFVFGSNATGFHGAGGAGVAMRGTASNSWQNDPDFLLAMSSPPGSPARVGKWAIYGVPKGYQRGVDGASYAIVSIEAPGKLRSVSKRDIYYQLVDFVKFAKDNSELTFLVTPIGERFAGYTTNEMLEVWRELDKRHGIPSNVRLVRVGK